MAHISFPSPHSHSRSRSRSPSSRQRPGPKKGILKKPGSSSSAPSSPSPYRSARSSSRTPRARPRLHLETEGLRDIHPLSSSSSSSSLSPSSSFPALTSTVNRRAAFDDVVARDIRTGKAVAPASAMSGAEYRAWHHERRRRERAKAASGLKMQGDDGETEKRERKMAWREERKERARAKARAVNGALREADRKCEDLVRRLGGLSVRAAGVPGEEEEVDWIE
ncbi:hypothetical protein F5X99DRAFT_410112 [Biscogniauxia marginata]|nr:hypothetical protein F5X99DRAFT_410112 [Biscogniauxia marginata]